MWYVEHLIRNWVAAASCFRHGTSHLIHGLVPIVRTSKFNHS
jgi:hypothetical protein